MKLAPETLEQISTVIIRYKQKKSAILPILHLIQKEKRFISKSAIVWVANQLGMLVGQVEKIVENNPNFRRKPMGRVHIRVCQSLTCSLRGSQKTCEAFQKELACGVNETTKDGTYSLELTECLSNCNRGPSVMINGKIYRGVSPEKVPLLLKNLPKNARSGQT